MTLMEQIITIAICILCVQFTRLLPFWIFPANRPIPEYIRYLGKVLPAAMFGMLVVYCYKNVDVLSSYHGLPDFIAGALVLGLHFWKKNMFISISAGTIFYMFLVQKVFILANVERNKNYLLLQSVAFISPLSLNSKIFYDAASIIVDGEIYGI